MALGPVDVAVIGFPGNKFTGEVAPAIADLVESGTIRILDILFVMKDADGIVTSLEIGELDPQVQSAFVDIEVHAPGALGDEDADEIGDDLPLNSSTLIIAWENTWMERIVGALRGADAVLIDQIRIPADVVEAFLAESV